MIQIIEGIKNSIAGISPEHTSPGTLADADPIALITVVACLILGLAWLIICATYGRNSK